MEFFKDLCVLLGRVCISLMFLWGALDRILNWNEAMMFLKSRNIPYLNIVMPIVVFLQVLGGLLVFFGYHAHFGALLLMIVLIPTAIKLHPFWEFQGEEKTIEKHRFMKYVAILGGLLMILALGTGHWGFSGS